jgi:hypothetical protein
LIGHNAPHTQRNIRVNAGRTAAQEFSVIERGKLLEKRAPPLLRLPKRQAASECGHEQDNPSRPRHDRSPSHVAKITVKSTGRKATLAFSNPQIA